MYIFNKKLISALAISFLSATTFAKPVNMYDQPATTGKVIGTIDSAASMVPIISSKAGDWMKVGDPQNGNVGWIKVSELGTNTPGYTSTGFTMSEHTVQTDKGPRTYKTIQFSGPNQAQANEIMRQIQQNQAQFQKVGEEAINNIYQTMSNAFQNMYENNGAALKDKSLNYPIIMPILVVPAPAPQTPKQHPAPSATPKN